MNDKTLSARIFAVNSDGTYIPITEVEEISLDILKLHIPKDNGLMIFSPEDKSMEFTIRTSYLNQWMRDRLFGWKTNNYRRLHGGRALRVRTIIRTQHKTVASMIRRMCETE